VGGAHVSWFRDPARLTIMVSSLISLAFLITYVWFTHGHPDTEMRRRTLVSWIVLVLVRKLMSVLFRLPRILRGRSGRPARLDIADGAFVVPPFRGPASAAGDNIMVISVIIGLTLEGWWPAGSRPKLGASFGWLTAVALLVALAVYLAMNALRGSGLRLSPDGLIVQTALSHRLVPWDAIKPNTPQRALLRTPLLTLQIARPEQVQRSGPVFGSGRIIRIPLDFNTHPWFLTDTIRWYVDHPDDRAAIGTAAELDRLQRTLTVSERPAARR
jgi:hypothetical protein